MADGVVASPVAPALPETRDVTHLHRLIFAGLLVLLAVGPFVLYPVFLMKVLCFALFACAFNLLLGYGGLLSFGHAAYFGMASYVSAYGAKVWGLTPELAILAGTLTAALLGLVMLVASQAMAIWGTHFLSAGTAAVFGSSAPLFLALFAWGLLRRPLTMRQTAGVLIGFVGLVLMGWSSARAGDLKPLDVGLALVAAASWAAGSLLAPRLSSPHDPVVGRSWGRPAWRWAPSSRCRGSPPGPTSRTSPRPPGARWPS